MGSIRWYSLVAALVLTFGASPLFSQSPLEELEAKLQQKNGKTDVTGKKTQSGSEEALPLPDRDRKASSKSVELQGFGPKTTKPPVEIPAVPPVMPTLPNPTVADDPPYLGMTLERMVTGETGLRVVNVTEQSPAWKAGFRIGDRVLAVSGTAVNDIDGFAGEIARFAANEPISFLVDRRGRQTELVAVMLPRSLAMRLLSGVDVPDATTLNRTLPPPPSRSSPTMRSPQRVDGPGSIGLVLAPLSDAFRRQFGIPVFRGASVLEVVKNSPGHTAGLAPGDCIVELDGTAVLSDEDVVKWKGTAAPGSLASVGFYRGASKMQTTLQVPIDTSEAIPPGTMQVSPDMLTPEFIRSLQAELSQTRAELVRVQEELDRLKAASGR